MGNIFSSIQNNRDHEQMLVQNEHNENNNQPDIQPPLAKKVYGFKNPVLLKKHTLSLEREPTSLNSFYIKFNYDALLNFNCSINFDVSPSPLSSSSQLIPNESNQDPTQNSSSFSLNTKNYISSPQFTSK